MTDIFLLLGSGLCLLSVLAAVVDLLRTQAPRTAAILLVAGLVVLGFAAWREPGSVGAAQLGAAWDRLFN
ncbi:hypothetical protein [Paracoccus albus]|uniref:hypothetical protein n=1 Tax=Paracoccus albus TaxID=3017784 RepID=UPI0022F0CAA6|nr:hypothetical protein [Paracoccus albus]WBU61147.1 hypothetical protein PAF20_04330 [Paracoccus albus]